MDPKALLGSRRPHRFRVGRIDGLGERNSPATSWRAHRQKAAWRDHMALRARPGGVRTLAAG